MDTLLDSPVKKLKLGKLELSSNIIYAPLAGVSDFPFRKMSAGHKPGLMFCEMVKMQALVRQIPRTLDMLTFSEDMRPIGGQICGSDPKLAAPAAKMIEEMGFDLIDLNCGCPVDKITKDGSGSGMLKEPELIGEVIANMVAAVNIPVTVKVRAGWDASSINAAEVTRIVEQAGAKAIFVHGRTRQQAYRGPAIWDHIKAAKEAATSIHVIGNGDLFSPEAVESIYKQTGCDGFLIARGTMGYPWIVDDIKRHFRGEAPYIRTPKENRDAMVEHIAYSTKYKTEKGALIDVRKICCWYLKNVVGAREFRKVASHAASLEEVYQLIDEFELCPA